MGALNTASRNTNTERCLIVVPKFESINP